MVIQPTVFKPIGQPFKRVGKMLVAIKRPDVLPKDACKGCYFVNACNATNTLACSSFDRYDKTSVWFVEAKDAKQK